MLTSLPRARPVRRSAKRGDRTDAPASAAGTRSRGAAAPRPTAAKATTARATAARAKPPAGGAATPRAAAEAPRTAPRRKVPPAGYAAPTSGGNDDGGAGTADLLSTTIQAAAELAQIGLTVGRQTLQSMLDRLPKP